MRKEIAFYVFSQYLYILEAQKNLDIQLDNLELQQRIYDQVQVQYASGEKALLDLKQSEISLIDYEIAVNEAENGLIQQRQDLFTYLNIPDEGYDFIEPEFDISEEEFVYQENYTLIQKRNSIKSSKISLFQQKVDFLPSLTFSFYYQNSSLSDDIDNFSKYDDSYTISLAASFDIFDLFEKRESFVRSRRNLEIEELDLENSEQELRSELSNLINDMKTLRRSRDLYLDKLNLAEENLSMAQEQFRLGIISLLDLDRTKIEYQNAQLSYNNRYYELIRKQEEINKTLSRNILGKW
jgi:outer membrane protein TolC